MRALVLSVSLCVLNVAFSLALSKGWADRIPNSLVAALWILPIIPLAWWAWTHEETIRRRQWATDKFHAHPVKSSIITAAVVGVVLVSLAGAGHRLWANVSPPQVATNNPEPARTKPSPTPPTPTAPINGPSSPLPKSRPKTKPQPKSSQKPETPVVSVGPDRVVTVAPPSVSQNCPNGVCIGGDNKGTATVINNGPPPLPTPTVKVCASYDSVKPQATILVTTNGQVPRPFFAFFFDGPVLDGSAELNSGSSFGYTHGRAERMPNPERSFVIRISTINFATTTWFPSDGAIKVTVPSETPVHLVRVLAGAGDDPDAVFQENIVMACN